MPGSRVLIVDPCPQARLVLTPFLEEQGFALSFVRNAQEALAALWAGPFSFVLVDTTDPAAGGEGLLAALRASDPARSQSVIPIIPLGDAAAESRLRGLGYPACFTKPFDFHVMTMVLDDLAPSMLASPRGRLAA